LLEANTVITGPGNRAGPRHVGALGRILIWRPGQAKKFVAPGKLKGNRAGPRHVRALGRILIWRPGQAKREQGWPQTCGGPRQDFNLAPRAS